MTTKHTPLEILEPYTNRPTVYPLGISRPEGNVHDIIGEITRKDRAEFIVRACNAHYQQSDALALAVITIKRLAKTQAQLDSVKGTLDVIEAAIAKAEGKE